MAKETKIPNPADMSQAEMDKKRKEITCLL